MRWTPPAEREERHAQAMAETERGDLGSVVELWLAVKETGRLAERMSRASERQLEGWSHYVTEPAAEGLAKSHPAVAARLFRALCVRILNAAKSQYYSAALANLEKARQCYEQAGQQAEWNGLVAEIRRRHHRKTSFMPGLERIVAGGAKAHRQPSLAERARRRWDKKRIT